MLQKTLWKNTECIMLKASVTPLKAHGGREGGWTLEQGSIIESSCCSLLEAGSGMQSHGSRPIPILWFTSTKARSIYCPKWMLIFGRNENIQLSWWCDVEALGGSLRKDCDSRGLQERFSYAAAGFM